MVAIKRMHSDLLTDAEFVARFLREIELTGLFDHPNLIQVHQSGIDPVIYYVMPVVDGSDLKVYQKRLSDEGKMIPLPEIVEIIIQTAKGLKYAHDFEVDGEPANIVHRDLKPENIFMNRGGQVLVADFGMARVDNKRLTQSGSLLGTPLYMSPQQAMAKNVDKTADIYALGVILYKLATGITPFEKFRGTLVSLIAAKGDQEVHDSYSRIHSLNPDVPPGLEDISRKAMAFNNEDRYQDLAMMIDDLEALKKDPSKRFNVKIRRSAKKKRQIGGAFGVLVTLLSSLGLSFLLTSFSKPDRRPIAPVTSRSTPDLKFLTWDQLQEIVRRESIEKAIERLDREIRENATNGEVGRSYYYRARLLIEQAAGTRDSEKKKRLYQKAIEDLDKAILHQPDLEKNPHYYYYRAIIKAGMGDLEGMNENMRLFLEKANGADANFELLKKQLEELRNRINLWGGVGLLPQIPPFGQTLPFELAL